MNKSFNFDRIDQRILDELQRDCRLSNQQLADRIDSSASSVWRRVRALEEAAVVTGYHLHVDAAKLGYTETVLLHVSLETLSEKSADRFTRWIATVPEVLECFAVSGEYDYQLKVLAPDMRAYYRFLETDIMSQDFIARTSSTVVLRKIKDTVIVPTQAPMDK